MEKHKIIVGYDFQELSNAALKQAYELARFVNSGILLVLVISDDLLTLSDVFKNEHSDRMKKKITDSMHREIAGRLQKVAEDASAKSGVAVDFRIETGRIYEQILKIAKENRARFIVMGRTSKELDRGRFGSNAMHVAEAAPCPVITIPAVNFDASFKNIVLPIDLTKQTREEVFNAISFGLFFDATIHLVSVIMGGVSAQKSRIYKKMLGMKKMIEENGVRCTDKLFKKSHLAIHEVVLNYARDIHADNLMLMTHQEISSSDKYIGAVAHQIIREAPMPVISLTSAASMHKQNVKSLRWFQKLFATSK
jgi:nucleotide-binding universal stress UspA family protein